MDSELTASRNEIFQTLKPYCIDLSKLALKKGDDHALIQSTERLLEILLRVCSNEAFDEKLADYVFFPLSQILRAKNRYTDHLSELTAKCLRLLLERGWRNVIAIDLGKQLLILLTLMAGGVPEQDPRTIPEELTVEALGGLAALFRALASNPDASTAITDASTLLALGHCLTTILDAITEGSSAEIQIQALDALKALWNCVRDVQAQANFLPGTVSSLTKCLTPSTSSRRTQKTIIAALESMQLVLTAVLSDVRTRNVRAGNNVEVESTNGGQQAGTTQSWLNATTSQVKLALANVVKLRKHKSDSVRPALNRFCTVLLDECHDTLIDSIPMLVETCLTLIDVEDTPGSGKTTTIIDLAAIHADIGDSIKSTFYHWISGLPRVLQMNDEAAKVAALRQISAAYRLLCSLDLSTSMLEDVLSQSLTDGISAVIDASSSPRVVHETSVNFSSEALRTFASQNASVKTFRHMLLPEESQKPIRFALSEFLSSIGTSQSRMNLANEMLDYVRGSSGSNLLAAYWVSSQLIENVAKQNDEIDEFLESALLVPEGFEAASQDLYSYSMSVLATDESSFDWRMEAIALEVISHSAQRAGKDFQGELVEILYPVSQLLGSPSHELRERAMVCLNILSESCGYPSVRELIVENVDYMVNSISLRLNTFDISPQAPQVLIMIIRLTGPSLLPYLDDVVSSIFAALDNFHGYQGLVESLFTVLGEIVETGAQSPQVRLLDAPAVENKKASNPAITLTSIVQAIGKQIQRRDTEEELAHEQFPQKPWKDASSPLDQAGTDEDDEIESTNEAVEVQKPPPTKTYTMIQNIAQLSQHYLTNQSPVLRTRLLNLITTSSLALQNDQESFLPLVNDIWPVLIDRLYDGESFVAIAAADAISTLCKCAGDFLATRIAVQWQRLMNLAKRCRKNMQAEKSRSSNRGIYSQVAQMWEAMVRLLCSIVDYAGINDDAFDDVLELLGDVVRDRPDVRDALSAANADAVWLVLQASSPRKLKTPSLEGYQFLPLDSTLVI